MFRFENIFRKIGMGLSIFLGVCGLIFIGFYVVAVAHVYWVDAPDKSVVFWYLIFLFGGLMLCQFAVFLYFISKKT